VKQPELLRTSALRVRLTGDEHRVISAVAAGAGLGICSYARMVVVRAAGLKASKPPRRKPGEDAKVLARFLGELGKIGSNINQLAHDHNQGFDVDPAILGQVRDELKNLREALLAYVEDKLP
jgi:hypothetical protein